MTKTSSDESLRELLRLLIDEIVDDLSQKRQRMREQVGSKTKSSMDAVVVLVELAGTFRPSTITSWSEYLVDRKGA